MNYSVEVSIDLPRERVVELFDSQENLYEWQTGLQDLQHISGEPGKAGAKMQMLYEERGRKVEMIETILENNLPESMSATYEAKGVWNSIHSRFIEETPGQTRWVMESEFKFSGLMKLVGFFMRSAFPRQTLDDMNKFKAFAEKQA